MLADFILSITASLYGLLMDSYKVIFPLIFFAMYFSNCGKFIDNVNIGDYYYV